MSPQPTRHSQPSTALRNALILIGLSACLALQACATQHWRDSYVSTAPAAALPKEAPVEVREVPWDRLQAGLSEIQNEQSKSDVAPQDWTPEKKAAVRAELLRTLQVSKDPATVTVIGRSDFRTTDDVRPESNDRAKLADFARQVGADTVVWSRSYLGKDQVIIQEPMTTYYSGVDDGHHRGRHGGGNLYSGTSTTWVPVTVPADEHAFVAYFLKTR